MLRFLKVTKDLAPAVLLFQENRWRGEHTIVKAPASLVRKMNDLNRVMPQLELLAQLGEVPNIVPPEVPRKR
jgi:hypothetical protein